LSKLKVNNSTTKLTKSKEAKNNSAICIEILFNSECSDEGERKMLTIANYVLRTVDDRAAEEVSLLLMASEILSNSVQKEGGRHLFLILLEKTNLRFVYPDKNLATKYYPDLRKDLEGR
jgi:hypothetical protein